MVGTNEKPTSIAAAEPVNHLCNIVALRRPCWCGILTDVSPGGKRSLLPWSQLRQ
jgi:hypothetical protein